MMNNQHFSSQTHDADSAAYIKHQKTIQEQAKRIAELEKKLEDSNAYAQTLEWAKDKAQQENKDLYYHINFVFGKRIKELEAKQIKWFSVEEKEPPKAINLLVYSEKFKRRGVQIGYIANDEWSKSITHWAMLPPPPTAEDFTEVQKGK